MDYRIHRENPFLNQHILTCGRHEIIRQAENRPDPIWLGRAVISVNDMFTEELEIVQSVLVGNDRLLTLVFADDHESFTLAHARAISDFVWKNHHSSFLVHCFIGASRSVAIAKWIAERLGIDDPELAAATSYNHHVYATLKGLDAE